MLLLFAEQKLILSVWRYACNEWLDPACTGLRRMYRTVIVSQKYAGIIRAGCSEHEDEESTCIKQHQFCILPDKVIRAEAL